MLLTFFLTGHVAAWPLMVSTHLTVRRRSSQSVTCSGGSWKAILATLHLTGCLLKVTATSDFKVTVMSLVQPAWRCPTYSREPTKLESARAGLAERTPPPIAGRLFGGVESPAPTKLRVWQSQHLLGALKRGTSTWKVTGGSQEMSGSVWVVGKAELPELTWGEK